MKLLVVNPNTTASMTAKIGAAARSVAAPGTEIEAVNPAMGPVSIEGFYDEALCLPGLLTEIAAGARRGAEAAIVACFDDPGIDAARAIAPFPVLGICEAAMRMAGFLGHRFTIVTTLPISLPAMDGLIRRYGMAERGRARAAGVPVLALEDRASGAVEKVRAEIRRAIAEDGAECILLGCAGMADLARDLTAEMGLPVIDGVAAAVKLAEGLVGLGLSTSKTGGYAPPAAKPYTGLLAGFAPAG
jgi:allantoin racemase